jgi:hypothetical protein
MVLHTVKGGYNMVNLYVFGSEHTPTTQFSNCRITGCSFMLSFRVVIQKSIFVEYRQLIETLKTFVTVPNNKSMTKINGSPASHGGFVLLSWKTRAWVCRPGAVQNSLQTKRLPLCNNGSKPNIYGISQ